jgi:hypothetical protein
MFKINLKTKAGNPISKKQTVIVWFEVDSRKRYDDLNNKIVIEHVYVFSIFTNKKIHSYEARAIRDQENTKSIIDLFLKVLVNVQTVADELIRKNQISPDYILFMSTSFVNSKLGSGIMNKIIEAFSRKEVFLKDVNSKYIDLFDYYKEFIKKYPSASIRIFSPKADKYEKSLKILESLKDKLKVFNLKFNTNKYG